MGLGSIEQREANSASYVNKLSKYRKWLKRAIVIRERRKAKKNPECVPGYRQYRGYEY